MHKALGSPLWPIAVAALLVAISCSPDPAAKRPSQGSVPAPSVGQKRLVAAVAIEPEFLYHQLNPSHVRGGNALEEMVNAGLARMDDRGALGPQLAERVPTTENGLWTVLPDGRMETSWVIRDGAVWQDGAPFTTDDLAFTLQVVRDRDLIGFANRAYDTIDRVDVIDARTIVVAWNRPFIQADTLSLNQAERRGMGRRPACRAAVPRRVGGGGS
jgi:peptide/nickel transport system substrate-binding protein